MEHIYVLKLQQGKWYVGKSQDVKKRYQQHVDCKGSAWTSKYPPVSLVESKAIISDHDENNITKDYMKRYGVDNVRGGSYTQIKLDDSMISVLNKEFIGNADKCFKCGLPGHFANKCKKQEEPEEEVWECDYCDRTFTTRFGCSVHEKSCNKPSKYIAQVQWKNYSQLDEADSSACFRCGRNSHWQKDCYAKKDIDGDSIEDDNDSDSFSLG